MKVVKNIIQYILTAILALAIIGLTIINICSSSVLNKNYILSKLDRHNYYDKIYEDTKSNFENYIYQSGLDESVIEDIVTKEKIKKDTDIIISNIYEGKNEKIDTDEIRNNLNEKIKKSLNGKIANSQKSPIEKFEDIICKEYESTISHTSYESKINDGYKKVTKYIDMAKKAVIITIVVCIVLIMLLTIKRIYRILARIGSAFFASGLILIIAEKYVNSKVRIEGITILNTGTSEVLRDVLTEMLNNVLKYGSILLSLGTVLIIIYGIIKSVRKYKRQKEQYTPEN